MKKLILVFLYWGVALVCDASVQDVADKAFYWNQKLGKGVNLGNALEAPVEGQWGVTLEAEDFVRIANAGFDSVRVPVRWSAHMQTQSPYKLHDSFLDRVDWVIKQATASGLVVVVNVHHFYELYQAPKSHQKQFYALWKQLARHYKDYPDTLIFEILNEPQGALDAQQWNTLLANTLTIIREHHPHRAVVVGPAEYNNFRQLPKLQLPKHDRNLIVTVHYYDPFQFTHQGAEWVSNIGSEEWLGRTWRATKGEKAELNAHFNLMADWAIEHNRPIYVGEFGVYQKADEVSRAKWTNAVVEAATRNGFSVAYWEYCSLFGLFDKKTNQWRLPLVKALELGSQ